MKKGQTLSTLIIVLMLIASLGHSQEQNNNESNDWEFKLAPYMLLASLSGDATVGIVGPTEFDVSFGDLLKNIQFAVMLHGEAQKGKWGVSADYLYMKLGDDLDTPTGGVLDATVQESILELLVNHRIKKEWGWIDFYGGIRWWDVDLELELDGIVNAGASKDEGWVDPVIGASIYYVSPKNIVAGLRADIGGFGAGSDFSYNIQPTLGYRFSDLFTLTLQYKLLDVDYNNEEDGRTAFAYDVLSYGPLLGFVFRF